ncbi:MAG: hypothetical protein HY303_06890 [Candidatus Wallbacteria bacterium]|nr:hypothetical protein [Candidatus Wallbacteria bacterium]
MITDEERERILGSEIEAVSEAIEEAVALAIEEHRRLGNSIAVWRDGRVVLLSPEEIPPYAGKSRSGR